MRFVNVRPNTIIESTDLIAFGCMVVDKHKLMQLHVHRLPMYGSGLEMLKQASDPQVRIAWAILVHRADYYYADGEIPILLDAYANTIKEAQPIPIQSSEDWLFIAAAMWGEKNPSYNWLKDTLAELPGFKWVWKP